MSNVIGFTKGVLYTHSFKSHFLIPFDRCNNRPTVHVYTIPKGLTVCFYWGFVFKLVWCSQVLGWSLNGSTLPGQADSQLGITAILATETGHWCNSILWHLDLKTTSFDAIWLFTFWIITFATMWLPTTPIEVLVVFWLDGK